jgi:large subunit ribosomal protein L6
MSRVAKKPIEIPPGVELQISGQTLAVKGPRGALQLPLPTRVRVSKQGNTLVFEQIRNTDRTMAGTMRSLVSNMLTGVSTGFERKLELVGIGYRVQQQGNRLNLTLGYSHPITYPIPEGIKIETPSATQIVVTGIDKQKVGQVAAEIRAFRAPEPYKGKGIKYANEQILRKEAKKK